VSSISKIVAYDPFDNILIGAIAFICVGFSAMFLVSSVNFTLCLYPVGYDHVIRSPAVIAGGDTAWYGSTSNQSLSQM
jgi:hypothetical protein